MNNKSITINYTTLFSVLILFCLTLTSGIVLGINFENKRVSAEPLGVTTTGLPILKGGTNATTAPQAATNILGTNFANYTGILPVAQGGTGITNFALNNTLTSTSTSSALTAKQGKVLNDKLGKSGVSNYYQNSNNRYFIKIGSIPKGSDAQYRNISLDITALAVEVTVPSINAYNHLILNLRQNNSNDVAGFDFAIKTIDKFKNEVADFYLGWIITSTSVDLYLFGCGSTTKNPWAMMNAKVSTLVNVGFEEFVPAYSQNVLSSLTVTNYYDLR
ncbi:MAG: hypothetical protein LBN03_01390 [Bifidobacteriaceae bacterium]|jgi:hypothetical protein|nr:hypothetical protein [Bifidobacteriaceae bacterium]